MDYNSQRKKLVLPEYGRHIYKMVDYALTIEDRDERTRCVNSIITVMGNLFPHLRDVSDFKHKLWDHIAIMSDFKLDIDFPYNLPEASNFTTKPLKVPYSDGKMKYRHYGKLVEQMIHQAAVMEDGELKNHLVSLISTHMRKSLMSWNKDNATDERIIQDIKDISRGKLIAGEQQVKLPEIRESQNRPRKKHFGRKNN